jgi:DNA repair exonuclease SbcCD ATPase subunit
MSITNASISITNFKGIKSKCIELSAGMSLVKGPSGAGKSTILESILYAITGNPKACKPIGSSAATRVEFVFERDGKKWSICRSTRPGRLVVFRGDTMVEDDEAQALIATVFGKRFDVVSYIPQDTSRSFMRMTPSEKLGFLENLMFGSSAETIKTKSKKYLKDAKSAVAKADAEHKVFESQLKKHPVVKLPQKPRSPSFVNAENSMRHLKQELRDDIKKMQTTKDKTGYLIRKEEQQQRGKLAAQACVDSLRSQIAQSVENIDKIKKEFQDDEDEEISVPKLVVDTQDAYNASARLRDLRLKIPKWAQVEKWKNVMKKKKAEKKEELNNVQENIKLAEKKNISFFDCPTCDASLSFNSATNCVKVEKQHVVKKVGKTIRSLLADESAINHDIGSLDREYKSVKALYTQIDTIEAEWGKGELDDLEELGKTLDDAKDLRRNCGRLKTLRAGLIAAECDLIAQCCDVDVEKLRQEIDILETSMRKRRAEFDEVDTKLAQIDDWHRQMSDYNKKNDDALRRMKAEESEQNARQKLQKAALALKGAEELKLSIAQAESLALVNFVNRINDHAALYLDAFFAEDPIEVSLKTFTAVKSKKKIKPEIQTEIQFKGNEIKLNSLSGGERARVVIAFNLALLDVLASPVAMLDEVTANLDSDLAETICEHVKHSTLGKIVLIVAHQCVDGTFDNLLVVQ